MTLAFSNEQDVLPMLWVIFMAVLYIGFETWMRQLSGFYLAKTIINCIAALILRDAYLVPFTDQGFLVAAEGIEILANLLVLHGLYNGALTLSSYLKRKQVKEQQ